MPGFQTKYEAWRAGASEAELEEVMSSNRVPRTPEFEPTVVPGKAGDLLIWDVRAPAAIFRPCCSCDTGRPLLGASPGFGFGSAALSALSASAAWLFGCGSG